SSEWFTCSPARSMACLVEGDRTMGTHVWNLVRLGTIALAAAVLLPGSPDVRADQFDIEGGLPTRWRAASPATIWNDATQTLTWHFNPLDFPQQTWPSVAQAGAAFEN